jgi:hypothetical protein
MVEQCRWTGKADGMNDSVAMVLVSGCSNFEDRCRGRLHEQHCAPRGDAMQGDLIFPQRCAGALARRVQDQETRPSFGRPLRTCYTPSSNNPSVWSTVLPFSFFPRRRRLIRLRRRSKGGEATWLMADSHVGSLAIAFLTNNLRGPIDSAEALCRVTCISCISRICIGPRAGHAT